MKRVLSLLIISLITVAGFAQRGQDFASKFMQQYNADSILQCVTVSPKMMEQLVKSQNTGHNEHIIQAIAKLKSARIITATEHEEDYYQMAEGLLKRNAKRFKAKRGFHNTQGYGIFYTRQSKGKTTELIMLYANKKNNKFVIINLTGNIDEEFINSLSKNIDGRTAKAYIKR